MHDILCHVFRRRHSLESPRARRSACLPLTMLLGQRGQLTRGSALARRRREKNSKGAARHRSPVRRPVCPSLTPSAAGAEASPCSPALRAELTGLNHDETLALVNTTFRTWRTSLRSRRRGYYSAVRQGPWTRCPTATGSPAATRRSGSCGAGDRPAFPPTGPGELFLPPPCWKSGAPWSPRNWLRIHYAARDQNPQWRTVDPVGLVTVRDRMYLLATRDGPRTAPTGYRECWFRGTRRAAQRTDQVDLDLMWKRRCPQFLSADHIAVSVRVAPTVGRRKCWPAPWPLGEKSPQHRRLAAPQRHLREPAARHVGRVAHSATTEGALPASLRVALGRRAARIANLYDESSPKDYPCMRNEDGSV